MIPELLLVEVLKLHLAGTPADETGWLRALRDPVLAPALAAIHAARAQVEPAQPGQEAASRCRVLDERFREVLGLAPIRYLTGWRCTWPGPAPLDPDLGVAAVAHRVGSTRKRLRAGVNAPRWRQLVAGQPR